MFGWIYLISTPTHPLLTPTYASWNKSSVGSSMKHRRLKLGFTMSPRLLRASLLQVSTRLMTLNWLYGRRPTHISFPSSLMWMRFIHRFIHLQLIRQIGQRLPRDTYPRRRGLVQVSQCG